MKDQFNLSDNHFKMFRSELNLKKELPSLYNLIVVRRRIEALFPIRKTFNGVSNELVNKLRSVLYPLITNIDENFQLKEDKLIRIKICGDGTNVGKKKYIYIHTAVALVINFWLFHVKSCNFT